MTLADLPLPSGVRRIADSLFDAARRGVFGLWSRGEHANAPAGEKLALLNRLTRILRYAFLMYAVWIETPPSPGQARARAARAKAPRGFRPHRAVFKVFPVYRVTYDDGGGPRPQPAAFTNAMRDPVLAAQRKRDALLHAIEHPLRYIRRIARRLPTQLMVIDWRPPKRPPPTDRRQYWDELVEGWRESWFQLDEWRRRWRDRREGASA